MASPRFNWPRFRFKASAKFWGMEMSIPGMTFRLMFLFLDDADVDDVDDDDVDGLCCFLRPCLEDDLDAEVVVVVEVGLELELGLEGELELEVDDSAVVSAGGGTGPNTVLPWSVAL